MVQININTTPEEQAKILGVIKKHENKTISVSTIAAEADMIESRARYTILDLIDQRVIERITTKDFNPRYRRYKYKIIA